MSRLKMPPGGFPPDLPIARKTSKLPDNPSSSQSQQQQSQSQSQSSSSYSDQTEPYQRDNDSSTYRFATTFPRTTNYADLLNPNRTKPKIKQVVEMVKNMKKIELDGNDDDVLEEFDMRVKRLQHLMEQMTFMIQTFRKGEYQKFPKPASNVREMIEVMDQVMKKEQERKDKQQVQEKDTPKKEKSGKKKKPIEGNS